MLSETYKPFLRKPCDEYGSSQKDPENATGVHDDLINNENISRSSGMAKTILQGTVKGARRRGRQKKRWEDNIKEWIGMGFGDSVRERQ